MLKNLLIILLLTNIYLSKQIKDQCEQVGMYNQAGTLNNSLTQTNFPTLKEALKNGKVNGQGGFGKVYLIDFREKISENFKKIAVKQIATFQVNSKMPNYKDYLENEINIMKLLNSDPSGRFIKYYGCKYERNPSYDSDAAEKAEKLNLKLIKQNKKPIKYSQREYFIYIFMEAFKEDLTTGGEKFRNDLTFLQRLDIYILLFKDLKILHQNYNLSHNDIKPDNIMMTSDIGSSGFSVKFIDYGLMESLRKRFSAGTKQFMHPDLYRNSRDPILVEGFDVYSLAISIFLLEMNDPIFFDLSLDCYGVRFTEKDCTAVLHDNILNEMDLNPQDVFNYSDEVIESSMKYGDKYFYDLKPFSECETLGCIIIHCVDPKVDSIPRIEDILLQLFHIKQIRLQKVKIII